MSVNKETMPEKTESRQFYPYDMSGDAYKKELYDAAYKLIDIESLCLETTIIALSRSIALVAENETDGHSKTTMICTLANLIDFIAVASPLLDAIKDIQQNYPDYVKSIPK